MVPLVNLGTAVFIVERGMRIAQFVLSEVARIEWAEVAVYRTRFLGHTFTLRGLA